MAGLPAYTFVKIQPLDNAAAAGKWIERGQHIKYGLIRPG